MQYVLLPASNDQYFLADCKEIIAIKEGVIDAPDFDESNLTYRLMYGAYKPQAHAHYSDEEVRAHITEAIDQWLIHIDGKNVINLGIEGIVISESVIKRQCTELQHPRATQDVAFAALVKAPCVFLRLTTSVIKLAPLICVGMALMPSPRCSIEKVYLPSPVKTNDSHQKSR
ncbi:hypothetical protein [Vibrio parahaemolyticus]|uniref:hypothetical protein n=1 Tax=Vibrio parahaemolyticus TaxID=670 RepID=UPI00214CE7D8|nr:hypothetical protein [Vibrio parahaemolyticus]